MKQNNDGFTDVNSEDPNSPKKLKDVMAKIKQLIEAEGVAASVTLHLPGHVEFMNHIETPYSCAKYERDKDGDVIGIRFRSKLVDYGGDARAQGTAIADTVNMIDNLAMQSAKNYMMFNRLLDQLKQTVDYKSFGYKDTSKK